MENYKLYGNYDFFAHSFSIVIIVEFSQDNDDLWQTNIFFGEKEIENHVRFWRSFHIFVMNHRF